MNFLLMNKDEQFVGYLKDVEAAIRSEALNGEDYLEITSLDPRIEKGYKILYKDIFGNWQEFVVQGGEDTHEDNDKDHKWFCESSFYETIGDYIEEYTSVSVPAITALTQALANTRWSVGTVDILTLKNVDFFQISAKEAVQEIANLYNGEIRTRVTVSGNKVVSRHVDILADRGYKLGKRFVYSKDLTSVTKVTQRIDVQTALYGYGKGLETTEGERARRLTFDTINDGKSYVEDVSARALWGRNKPGGGKAHIFGNVFFDEIDDPLELKDATIKELEKRKVPRITYECKVVDLKAYGSEHEGAGLGDTVAVIDKTFVPELRLEAKVISIQRNLLYPTETEIVLGNYRDDIIDSTLEDKDFIANARSRAAIWDRSSIITDEGTINAQFLTNLTDSLNTNMNSLGGYVYMEDGKGITTYDLPRDQNPTKAMQILGGAFRIANSKLPNGEFNYKTFGDGDGFVADYIVAGKLKGGLVDFDLTNGTLLIGNSIEDYTLYFDGSSLKIKLGSGKTVDEEIGRLDIKADTANSNADTAISSAYDAQQTANSAISGLTGKADKDNIKAQINMSSDTTLISNNNINLVGAVTVLSDLSSDSNLGNIYAGRMQGPGMDINLNTGSLAMTGGMTVTNANGQVLIDGSSNMFKIAKEMTIVVDAATNNNYTGGWLHHLGFVPTMMAYQVNIENVSGSLLSGAIPLPAHSYGYVPDQPIQISSVIRASVNSEKVFINYIRKNRTDYGRYVVIKIYLMKEALM